VNVVGDRLLAAVADNDMDMECSELALPLLRIAVCCAALCLIRPSFDSRDVDVDEGNFLPAVAASLTFSDEDDDDDAACLRVVPTAAAAVPLARDVVDVDVVVCILSGSSVSLVCMGCVGELCLCLYAE
jgi:hypothetical protein